MTRYSEDPWSERAAEAAADRASLEPEAFPRRGLAFRWSLALGGLLSLVLFGLLAAGVAEERARLNSTGLRHLAETGEVLRALLELRSAMPAGHDLAALEDSLSRSRGVEHRVLLAGPDGRIAWSSTSDLLGQRLAGLVAGARPGAKRSFEVGLAEAGRRWLSTRIGLGPERGEILLLADSAWIDRQLARYVRTHLAATALVVGLGWVLGWLLVRRWVRLPIARLARFIDRVEKGSWSVAEAGVVGGDEFGWLARRFAVMAERLGTSVTRLVAVERRATLALLTMEVARKLDAPLRRLRRDLGKLREQLPGEPSLREAAAQVERAGLEVEEVLAGLYPAFLTVLRDPGPPVLRMCLCWKHLPRIQEGTRT